MKFEDPRSPEEKAAAKVTKELEKVRARYERKQDSTRHMARQFYEGFIRENAPNNPDEMRLYAKRAWNAAVVYHDFIEEQEVVEDDDD